jgi:hypothetical protein
MAGFTWTESISQYGKVLAPGVNEIKAKTDYLKNNIIQCTSHYTSHLSTNYSSNLTANYSANCGANYDYCGGYYPSGGS